MIIGIEVYKVLEQLGRNVIDLNKTLGLFNNAIEKLDVIDVKRDHGNRTSPLKRRLKNRELE